MTRTRTTSPAAPAPLAPLEGVDLPQWAALVRARRRLDVVRSAVGRVATLAGAAAAAAGLFTGGLTGAALLTDAALTLGGLAALRLWKPEGHQRAAASVLYLGPGVSLAALLVAEQLVPGIHPGEALALTVWTVGTWVLRPARVARRMVSPLPAPVLLVASVEAQVVCDHPAARWWAQHVAIKGGAAPATLLDDVQRTGDKAMRAVIRSAIAGRPVPDISIRTLSALIDIPEDEITIDPVPGRGAGVRRLTVGTPEDSAEDLETIWTKRIAPAAMPGAVLTGVRTGEPGAGHTPTGTPVTPRSGEDA